jgi:hypothetical protein
MEKWWNQIADRYWLLSALCIAALYGGTLSFGLTYDDLLLIKTWPLAELMAKWHEPWSERFYRPLINFIFTGEHLLFGRAAWGYHLVNLVLAACIAGFHQLILRALHVRALPAFFSSLLWLALPGNGIIITWISAQIDLFALVFMLASFWLVITAAGSPRRSGRILLSLILAALAYSCKEIAVTLPLLIAAWLIISRPLPRRQAWQLALPHFLLWGGYFVWRAIVLGARTVGERGFSENPWVAAHPVAGVAGMIARYCEAMVSTLYPVFLLPSWLTALLLLSLLIALAARVWQNRRDFSLFRRESLLLLIFAAIAALPNMLDASPRLLGAPTLAVSTMVILALEQLLRSLPHQRPQLIILAALMVLSYLHINGQVQACFTQTVYQSTLQYEINDRRRWPFSDLHNVRYQIRETVLRMVQ